MKNFLLLATLAMALQVATLQSASPDVTIRISSLKAALQATAELQPLLAPTNSVVVPEHTILPVLGIMDGKVPQGLDTDKPIFIKVLLPEGFGMMQIQPSMATFYPLSNAEQFKAAFKGQSATKEVSIMPGYAKVWNKGDSQQKDIEEWTPETGNSKGTGLLGITIEGQFVRKNADMAMAMLGMFGGMPQQGGAANPAASLIQPAINGIQSLKSNLGSISINLDNTADSISLNFSVQSLPDSEWAKSLAAAARPPLHDFSSLWKADAGQAIRSHGRIDLTKETMVDFINFGVKDVEKMMTPDDVKKYCDAQMSMLNLWNGWDYYISYSFDSPINCIYASHKKGGVEQDKLIAMIESYAKTMSEIKVNNKPFFDKISFKKNHRTIQGQNIHLFVMDVNFDNRLHQANTSNNRTKAMTELMGTNSFELAQWKDFVFMTQNKKGAMETLLAMASKNSFASTKSDIPDLSGDLDLAMLTRQLENILPERPSPEVADLLKNPAPLNLSLSYIKDYNFSLTLPKSTLSTLGKLMAISSIEKQNRKAEAMMQKQEMEEEASQKEIDRLIQQEMERQIVDPDGPVENQTDTPTDPTIKN